MKIPSSEIRTSISTYRRRAIVVREIHSGIAESKRKWDLRHTVSTVALGAAITFFGFMGPDRIFDSLPNQTKAEVNQISTDPKALSSSVDVLAEKSSSLQISTGTKATGSVGNTKILFDLGFNIATLLLFVTSLLNLIFRWKEDHTAHFQGVVKLTQFVNWLDEVETCLGTDAECSLLREIRLRYQVIVEQLPPNNRADYLAAKGRLAQNGASIQTQSMPTQPIGSDYSKFLVDAVKDSVLHMKLLEAMKEIDPGLWLGGGALRNLVWDVLTGRSNEFEDFDVVFFKETNMSIEDERKEEDAVEMSLKRKISEKLNVSVRNQARMHTETNEPARTSLLDAISNWPETATAVAVQLSQAGDIVILAPHGLSDLFNMTIVATPYHKAHPAKFLDRRKKKNWVGRWPEVKYRD